MEDCTEEKGGTPSKEAGVAAFHPTCPRAGEGAAFAAGTVIRMRALIFRELILLLRGVGVMPRPVVGWRWKGRRKADDFVSVIGYFHFFFGTFLIFITLHFLY
jgi:hypothetical protein